MGAHPSRAATLRRQANTRRIVVLGLPGSGKTTLVDSMSRIDKHRHLPPAEGASDTSEAPVQARSVVQTTEFFGVDRKRWQVLDLPGDTAARTLWSHSYLGASALVFTLAGGDPGSDATCAAALGELRDVASSPLLRGVPICVAICKSDALAPASLAALTAAAESHAGSLGENFTVMRVRGEDSLGADADAIAIANWLGAHMVTV